MRSESTPFAPARPPRSARDELVSAGLPIVRRLAYRLARRLPRSVDVRDLIGAGTEGLLEAVDAYDVARAPKFEAFAEFRIRGAMLDWLRAIDPMTRYGRDRTNAVAEAIRKIEKREQRVATEDEIAAELGVSIDEYHDMVAEISRGAALGELAPADPDDVAAQIESPDRFAQRAEFRARLVAAIQRLPERSQRVLALYYQEECTQLEIAKILGVTEGRVCQILGEAIARLRGWLKEE